MDPHTPQDGLITLRAEDGRTAPAAATIERYSEVTRIGKAVGFFVGGFVLGGACIIVPVLHLVTTWALPLAGIVMGLRTLKIEQRLSRINGTCPACTQRIELRGGAVKAAIWRVCPECDKDLEIVLT